MPNMYGYTDLGSWSNLQISALSLNDLRILESTGSLGTLAAGQVRFINRDFWKVFTNVRQLNVAAFQALGTNISYLNNAAIANISQIKYITKLQFESLSLNQLSYIANGVLLDPSIVGSLTLAKWNQLSANANLYAATGAFLNALPKDVFQSINVRLINLSLLDDTHFGWLTANQLNAMSASQYAQLTNHTNQLSLDFLAKLNFSQVAMIFGNSLKQLPTDLFKTMSGSFLYTLMACGYAKSITVESMRTLVDYNKAALRAIPGWLICQFSASQLNSIKDISCLDSMSFSYFSSAQVSTLDCTNITANQISYLNAQNISGLNIAQVPPEVFFYLAPRSGWLTDAQLASISVEQAKFISSQFLNGSNVIGRLPLVVLKAMNPTALQFVSADTIATANATSRAYLMAVVQMMRKYDWLSVAYASEVLSGNPTLLPSELWQWVSSDFVNALSNVSLISAQEFSLLSNSALSHLNDTTIRSLTVTQVGVLSDSQKLCLNLNALSRQVVQSLPKEFVSQVVVNGDALYGFLSCLTSSQCDWLADAQLSGLSAHSVTALFYNMTWTAAKLNSLTMEAFKAVVTNDTALSGMLNSAFFRISGLSADRQQDLLDYIATRQWPIASATANESRSQEIVFKQSTGEFTTLQNTINSSIGHISSLRGRLGAAVAFNNILDSTGNLDLAVRVVESLSSSFDSLDVSGLKVVISAYSSSGTPGSNAKNGYSYLGLAKAGMEVSKSFILDYLVHNGLSKAASQVYFDANIKSITSWRTMLALTDLTITVNYLLSATQTTSGDKQSLNILNAIAYAGKSLNMSYELMVNRLSELLQIRMYSTKDFNPNDVLLLQLKNGFYQSYTISAISEKRVGYSGKMLDTIRFVDGYVIVSDKNGLVQTLMLQKTAVDASYTKIGRASSVVLAFSAKLVSMLSDGIGAATSSFQLYYMNKNGWSTDSKTISTDVALALAATGGVAKVTSTSIGALGKGLTAGSSSAKILSKSAASFSLAGELFNLAASGVMLGLAIDSCIHSDSEEKRNIAGAAVADASIQFVAASVALVFGSMGMAPLATAVTVISMALPSFSAMVALPILVEHRNDLLRKGLYNDASVLDVMIQNGNLDQYGGINFFSFLYTMLSQDDFISRIDKKWLIETTAQRLTYMLNNNAVDGTASLFKSLVVALNKSGYDRIIDFVMYQDSYDYFNGAYKSSLDSVATISANKGTSQASLVINESNAKVFSGSAEGLPDQTVFVNNNSNLSTFLVAVTRLGSDMTRLIIDARASIGNNVFNISTKNAKVLSGVGSDTYYISRNVANSVYVDGGAPVSIFVDLTGSLSVGEAVPEYTKTSSAGLQKILPGYLRMVNSYSTGAIRGNSVYILGDSKDESKVVNLDNFSYVSAVYGSDGDIVRGTKSGQSYIATSINTTVQMSGANSYASVGAQAIVAMGSNARVDIDMNMADELGVTHTNLMGVESLSSQIDLLRKETRSGTLKPNITGDYEGSLLNFGTTMQLAPRGSVGRNDVYVDAGYIYALYSDMVGNKTSDVLATGFNYLVGSSGNDRYTISDQSDILESKRVQGIVCGTGNNSVDVYDTSNQLVVSLSDSMNTVTLEKGAKLSLMDSFDYTPDTYNSIILNDDASLFASLSGNNRIQASGENTDLSILVRSGINVVNNVTGGTASVILESADNTDYSISSNVAMVSFNNSDLAAPNIYQNFAFNGYDTNDVWLCYGANGAVTLAAFGDADQRLNSVLSCTGDFYNMYLECSGISEHVSTGNGVQISVSALVGMMAGNPASEYGMSKVDGINGTNLNGYRLDSVCTCIM